MQRYNAKEIQSLYKPIEFVHPNGKVFKVKLLTGELLDQITKVEAKGLVEGDITAGYTAFKMWFQEEMTEKEVRQIDARIISDFSFYIVYFFIDSLNSI